MTAMERHVRALRAARDHLATATVESRMERQGPFFRATVTTTRRDGTPLVTVGAATREDLAVDLAWENARIEIMRDELERDLSTDATTIASMDDGGELYQRGPVGVRQVNDYLARRGAPGRDRDEIFRAARGLLLASSSAEPPTVRQVVNELPPQTTLPLSA